MIYCKTLPLNATSGVSTKWLNLLRKICAISAQIFFWELLRYFCSWNAMSFALFIYAQFSQNRKYFLRKLRMKLNFSFAQFAQNRKFYAKCNFLGKLSKIDILSLELNNWRFIPSIKKYYHTSMITIVLHSIGCIQLQKV